jgi:hypothetical protein
VVATFVVGCGRILKDVSEVWSSLTNEVEMSASFLAWSLSLAVQHQAPMNNSKD